MPIIVPATDDQALFATHEDLAALIGRTLTQEEQDRGTALLRIASSIVQTEAKQHIAYVADDVLERRGSRESAILLPERPVIAIASVTIDGDTINADDYTIDGHEVTLVGGWGDSCAALTITYTHGWADIPEAIKSVVLSAVMRVWSNPGGIVSQTLGAASTTFVTGGLPAGLLLTDDERRIVRRVVSTGTASLQLR